MTELTLLFALSLVGLLTSGYFLFLLLRLALFHKPVRRSKQKFPTVVLWSLNGTAMLIVVASLTYFTVSRIQGPEKRRVDIRFGHFYRYITAGDVDSAYHIMSPGYRESHTKQNFAREYQFVPDYYPLPGRYLRIKGNTATYYPGSERSPMSGPTYEWIQIGGSWYLKGFTWSLD